MTPGGVKHDVGKPKMDLLPGEALEQIAEVFTFGSKKYGRFNWRKGLLWSDVYSALQRHLSEWNKGNDLDVKEDCEGCQQGKCGTHSGFNHLANAGCNLLFLLTFLTEHPELDDRYGKEAQKSERDKPHPKRKSKAKKRTPKSKKETRKRKQKK